MCSYVFLELFKPEMDFFFFLIVVIILQLMIQGFDQEMCNVTLMARNFSRSVQVNGIECQIPLFQLLQQQELQHKTNKLFSNTVPF